MFESCWGHQKYQRLAVYFGTTRNMQAALFFQPVPRLPPKRNDLLAFAPAETL